MKGLTIGKFDRRITFLKKVEINTEYNTGKLTYATIDTNPVVWSNVQPFRTGSESLRADQITENRSTSFYIRHRTDINVKMVIAYNNSVYNIVTISEPSVYRKQVLQIVGELISEEQWP